MVWAWAVGASEGDDFRDRYLKRSSIGTDRVSVDERPGPENGVFRRKSAKSKARTTSIAEQAPASQFDTKHPRSVAYEDAAFGQSWGVPSGQVAASAAQSGGTAVEFDPVQDAVRQERLRISRDLHDHAGQYLVGIALRLAALEQTMANSSTSGVFADIRQLLERFCDEMRAISAGERRGIPFGHHLIAALTKLTAQWERETGIAIGFHSECAARIAPDDATAEVIFRIAEEALTNVAKHAPNASHVRVRLEIAPKRVRLAIEDDGPGLDSFCESDDKRPVRRGGITNMQERLAERGGQLVISRPPTGGTTVLATVPI